MTADPPGSILALQAAHRHQATHIRQLDDHVARLDGFAIRLQTEIAERDAYIHRLEQAVKDLLGLIQRGHIANTDLPMLDLIHQLLDGEQDP